MLTRSACAALVLVGCAASPPAAVAPPVDAGDRLAGKRFAWTLAGRAAETAQCREEWSFGPDGIMTVQSGDETTTKRYSLSSIPGESMRPLSMVRLTSNGRPDCVGNADASVGQQRQIYLQFLNSGGFFTCGSADGLSCYGVASPR